jgi:hypothetical protein
MTAAILCTRAVTRTTVHSADAFLSAFAAAVCGLADLGEGCVRLVGAGGPPPLPFRVGAGGEVRTAVLNLVCSCPNIVTEY